jgi:hypothetical protein
MIIAELTRINALGRFNEPTRSTENLAEILADELDKYDFDTIHEALREHPRRSEWWPKLSDILKLCDEVSTSRHYKRLTKTSLALPAPTEIPESQIAVNFQGIKNLRERLARKMDMKAHVIDTNHAKAVRSQAKRILEGGSL